MHAQFISLNQLRITIPDYVHSKHFPNEGQLQAHKKFLFVLPAEKKKEEDKNQSKSQLFYKYIFCEFIKATKELFTNTTSRTIKIHKSSFTVANGVK